MATLLNHQRYAVVLSCLHCDKQLNNPLFFEHIGQSLNHKHTCILHFIFRVVASVLLIHMAPKILVE